MREERKSAVITAAWVTGILACIGATIAAIIGLGLPFAQKLTEQMGATPEVIVVTATISQPVVTSQPSPTQPAPIQPTSPGFQNTPELASSPTVGVTFIPASMCPGIIPRSLVEEWSRVGETTIDTAKTYIDEFDRMRTKGEFGPQAILPAGVLIITDFGNGESFIYQSQPVRPVVHYRSWGVFETTSEYVAIQSGSCMSIKP